MIPFETNFSLLPFNTFGIDVKARYFVRIKSKEELKELIHSDLYRKENRFILGGGSNVLFTKDFEGLVIKIEIPGIEKLEETGNLVTLKAGAGVPWHQLVMHCVDQGWGGIENLSLIPGTVGAAPIQNIGAYGVELKEVVKSVEVLDAITGEERTYSNAQCRFGYRESIFKQELKEKFFISSVTLTLTLKNHLLRTEYGALRDTFKQHHADKITLRDVSDAVIRIRESKLPDPKQTGNAGSFFKNPSVPAAQYESLKKQYPEIPGYPSVNQEVKVPAGWLIEQCGWKGKKISRVGVHAQQALVLVNFGGGTGAEIFHLAMKISQSVEEKFGVRLMMEVNVV